MDISLAGKRAFVCGSTQGIGRAAALEIAAQGAAVTLVARNAEALAAAVGELDATRGQSHDVICADFTRPQEVAEKAGQWIRANGTVHILMNNTGGPSPGPITEAKPGDFLRAFSSHLICNQLLVQAVLPGMKAAGYGRIINIISTTVREPIAGLGVSNTTRGAVASWAKTLSGEAGPFGITVNNVLPGFTDTERLRSLMKNRAEAAGIPEEELIRQWQSALPLRRFASVAEIANAIAFLASPAASYITGVSLPVDGGKISAI